eukprot:13488787-Heterocapsa_arctica.AAC.1
MPSHTIPKTSLRIFHRLWFTTTSPTPSSISSSGDASAHRPTMRHLLSYVGIPPLRGEPLRTRNKSR